MFILVAGQVVSTAREVRGHGGKVALFSHPQDSTHAGLEVHQNVAVDQPVAWKFENCIIID